MAGGFLVLDRQYTGLVFGLDARIHVAIQESSSSSNLSTGQIIVCSPQFLEAQWKYELRDMGGDGGVQAVQTQE